MRPLGIHAPCQPKVVFTSVRTRKSMGCRISISTVGGVATRAPRQLSIRKGCIIELFISLADSPAEWLSGCFTVLFLTFGDPPQSLCIGLVFQPL